MSAFGQVSRAILSITTALNVARLAGRGLSQEEYDLMLKEVQILRAIARTTDKIELSQLNDELAITRDRLKTIKQERADQYFNDVALMVSTFGTTIGVLTPQLIKLIPILKSVNLELQLMKVSLVAVAGFVSAISGIITGLVIGFISFPSIDEWLRGQAEWYAQWANFRDNVMGPAMNDFFLITIPNAVTSGVLMMQNVLFSGFVGLFGGLIPIINAGGKLIVDGINSVVRAVVNAINTVIALYNVAASKLGRSTIKQVSFTPIQFTPIGEMPSFENNALQLGTGIPVGPVLTNNSTGRAGSQTVIINNHFAGSLWSTQELMRTFDDYFKTELKRRGFTGF